MRKIDMPGTIHNGTARLPILIAISVLLNGCGGGDNQDAMKDTNQRSTPKCVAVVDDTAMRSFYELADRVAAGDDVDLAAMEAVAATPAWDRWRRNFGVGVTTEILGRMFYISMVGRENIPPDMRELPARSNLNRAYTLALAERERSEAFVADFVYDELPCQTLDLLQGWLDRGALPDTLRIDLVVAPPAIDVFEDRVLLDCGLAWAAGREQLPRFVASALYRYVARFKGPSPTKSRGPEIVYQTVRAVCNEVVPSYFDQPDRMAFDRRHETMKGRAPRMDDATERAGRVVRDFDTYLTRVRAMSAPTDEDWLIIYRLFVGSQAWQPAGWLMARTISDRLGEEALQRACGHPADLVAAYASACKEAPAKADASPGTLAWNLQNPPPLSDDNVAWLVAGLRNRLP